MSRREQLPLLAPASDCCLEGGAPIFIDPGPCSSVSEAVTPAPAALGEWPPALCLMLFPRATTPPAEVAIADVEEEELLSALSASATTASKSLETVRMCSAVDLCAGRGMPQFPK